MIDKISYKTKHGLPVVLMISSFFLMLAVCMFILGYIMIQRGTKEFQVYGMTFVLLSFPLGIGSTAAICRFCHLINMLTDYGTPVFKAAQYIKEIVNRTNVHAVDSLHGLIESNIKEQLSKILKEEVNRKKGK
jgi:hypothetical protein